MKNIVLIMNAIVLVLTLSIIILPKVWMISIVGGADGPTGMVFPIIWTVYIGAVFLTAGLTFSWLVKRGK